MEISVSIVNRSPHPLPAYHSEGAAGLDLRAWLELPVVLAPMERRLIPTGIYIALPDGFEAQVRPRSGLAIKKGLTLINAPGTIDSDYRGELMVALVNLSNEHQEIADGDRIAQLVVARYTRIGWNEVTDLEATERGAGGFGHSGLK